MLLSRQVKLDLKVVKRVCCLFVFFGMVWFGMVEFNVPLDSLVLCVMVHVVSEVNTTFSCEQASKQCFAIMRQ